MEQINEYVLSPKLQDEEDYIIECIEKQAEYDDHGWLEFANDEIEYVEEPYEYDDFDYNNGSEWTEEGSWWALTDGMYGDMPNNPIAYDAMMDAIGF